MQTLSSNLPLKSTRSLRASTIAGGLTASALLLFLLFIDGVVSESPDLASAFLSYSMYCLPPVLFSFFGFEIVARLLRRLDSLGSATFIAGVAMGIMAVFGGMVFITSLNAGSSMELVYFSQLWLIFALLFSLPLSVLWWRLTVSIEQNALLNLVHAGESA